MQLNMKKVVIVGIFAVTLLFASCSLQNESGVPANASIAEASADIETATEKELENETKLEVHYMDVGQGDATLITCDGQAMLIDAGNNDKGTAIQQYLAVKNITALDYVIGTHADADHIGGLDVIITKFDCGTIFLTDEEKDTATYRDVLDAISYRGYSKTAPAVGKSYELGSAEFTIAGPSCASSDSNNNSIAIILRHGNNKFYFEGDAEEQEEDDILATGIDISASVYKTGHHGSRTSTSDRMLDAVNPTCAVISAGAGNSYGHPNAETLNKLRSKGVEVFRTDEQGTIVVVSDGNTITWNCSPSETWQAGEPTGGSGDYYTKEASFASAGSLDGTEGDAMVHITDTGSKYHLAGCGYLKESDREVSLPEAKAMGLTPCSKCNPPQ